VVECHLGLFDSYHLVIVLTFVGITQGVMGFIQVLDHLLTTPLVRVMAFGERSPGSGDDLGGGLGGDL
jgi:hypothetical protein